MKHTGIAASILLALASLGSAQEVVPGRVDGNERVLLDTTCDAAEWANAARTRVSDSSELLALQDPASVYLCVTLPPDSYGTMDLYVVGADGGEPFNLHASAQVGERRKAAGVWPDWTFGNHRLWYSPPVAATGASVVDSRARMTFGPVAGREVAIDRRKLGVGPWRFMAEIRALGTDKRGTLTFPATGKADDTTTWATLRLDDTESRAVVAEATVMRVPSPALGEPRIVWISVPSECTAAKKCPTLYVLDAHALFPLATSYIAVMKLMNRMDPLVVVGIPSWSQAGRARDFIPVPGVTDTERERLADAKGAERFGAFLAKDLVPFVEVRFPVTAERTLAGHSLAGLYAVHSLGSADTFANLIAVSPTLGWAEEGALRAFLDRLKEPRTGKRRLFASVAGGDSPAYHTAFTRLSNSVPRAKASWLKHRFERYSDDDHVTTVAPALQDALRWLYPKN